MKARSHPEMPVSSMADVAFLLLTFFLVTTQISEDKGLTFLLPPVSNDQQAIHDRNLYTIFINANNEWLVEGEVRQPGADLASEIQAFILNHGHRSDWSTSPEDAVISLKTDRGTSHQHFVRGLDLIQSAYYRIYADRAGITPAQFRALDLSVPADRIKYESGRKGIPMNISLAEPSAVADRR